MIQWRRTAQQGGTVLNTVHSPLSTVLSIFHFQKKSNIFVANIVKISTYALWVILDNLLASGLAFIHTRNFAAILEILYIDFCIYAYVGLLVRTYWYKVTMMMRTILEKNRPDQSGRSGWSKLIELETNKLKDNIEQRRKPTNPNISIFIFIFFCFSSSAIARKLVRIIFSLWMFLCSVSL